MVVAMMVEVVVEVVANLTIVQYNQIYEHYFQSSAAK
jgi:hypothetical protein